MTLVCTLFSVWGSHSGYVFAKNVLAVDINSQLQKAQELYRQRENRKCLESAIEQYKNILKQLPRAEDVYGKTAADIYIQLSKCYYKMATYHAYDNKEMAMCFKTGEEYGRNAMSLDPYNIGGYYWMAQNLGQHGSINKLYFLKKKGDFEDALKKAELLDNPDKPYDYSGVYRTLTAYYTPRFLWGNLDKALEYAGKIEATTCYLCNLSVLADLYLKVDKKKSQEYANQIIHADLSHFPETRFENSFEQKEIAQKWRLP